MSTTVPAFTEEFRTTIVEFAKDLSTTFPEYASSLEIWTQEDISDFDMQDLFEHCLKVYPERFFDIIKQSSAMVENTTIDLHFFPDVDFRSLLTCEGVSSATRESIWKYLQVVLLILVKSMESKVEFGEAMNMFDNIDVNELQTQLTSTIAGISQFFEKMEQPNEDTKPNKTNEENDQENDEGNQTKEKSSRSVPNMENIQDHLQSLFNGKIGKLAKELADDMSEDLSKTFGKDMENIHSTKDVLDAIMKDPSKMGNVVNTVKDKLTEKMESGDITKEDLVSEASDMMNKMKGLGGMGGGGMANMAESMANGDMADLMQSIGGNASMFQDLAKSMGMKIPKGSKLNTSAMEAQQKKISLKERLRNRAIAKKQEEVAKKMEEVLQQRKREEEYNKMIQDNPDLADFEKLVFSLEGEEKQEKSAVRDPNELSASQKKRLKKKARKQKHEQEKAAKTSETA